MFGKKDFWTHETPIHWERSVWVIPMWRNEELATKKDMDSLRKLTAQTEQKLDLILDHLKLKYVPETETKEPAKLVEKTNLNPFLNLKNGAIINCPDVFVGTPFASGGGSFESPPTKPKKKRGRPKKK